MNSIRNIAHTSLAVAQDAANPAILRAGLVAVAGKSKELAATVAEAAPSAAGKVASWTVANPGSAACAVVATAGVTLVAAPMAAAAPFMALAGFGSAGPIGGTLAAGAQAAAGNVVAGGLFATVQSAAMGGYGVALVSGAVQAVGASIAGVATGVAAFKGSKL